MKKMTLGIVALSMATLNVTYATAPKTGILTYNKTQLVKESKEGKAFLETFEKKKKSIEEEARKKEQDLRAMSERVQKQAAMLTEDALRKKGREMGREVREAERNHKACMQELEIEFRDDQAEVEVKLKPFAVQVFKNKDAAMLFDNGNPEVVAFDPSTDITTDAIKLADAAYEKAGSAKSA